MSSGIYEGEALRTRGRKQSVSGFHLYIIDFSFSELVSSGRTWVSCDDTTPVVADFNADMSVPKRSGHAFRAGYIWLAMALLFGTADHPAAFGHRNDIINECARSGGECVDQRVSLRQQSHC